ncbi:MAG: bifunctional diguanylate cyclase/phosphodiesterase [Candidatus Dactylopiibacterium sp.]|nr:bifunctional diguanylate cyclase/phosphodiesterase [Candidatus Dactylopiibacterium sp.]
MTRIDPDFARSPAARTELLRQAYRQQPGSIVVACITALGVSAIVSQHGVAIWLWFAAMLATSILRFFNQASFVSHGLLTAPALPPEWRWRIEAGQLASALLWAGLAIFWLPRLDDEGRYVTLIVLSALAAGATSVLAPLKGMGRVFIVLMLVPGAAVMLTAEPARPELAALALLFLGVMFFSHHNNHRILLTSLALRIERAELVERLVARAHEVETLNAGLEEKVHLRTLALEQMAESDALTGLLNRRGLRRRLEARLEAQPEPRPDEASGVAVLLFDLAHFKLINNRLGYAAGDEVLCHVAQRVRAALPPDADFSRWGGNEFVVVMGGATAGARLAWQIVRKTLLAEITVSGEPHLVSARAGSAVQGLHGQTAADLLDAADLALTELKRHGRGSFLFYRDELAPQQRRRLDLAFEIQQAGERGELHLLYQPIVAAASGRVETLEALLRWRHPRFGMVPPDEFIPIVEESAAINRLGLWVLREACREAAGWPADGLHPAPRVAVNVSVLQLCDADFPQHVAEVLRETGLSPLRLDIEVTESVFEPANVERVSLTLSRLCTMDLRVHVDDFGTGYSSLSRLHALPINAIKIDRSFVAGLDNGSTAIIEGAILIARRFGLQTIAEGVETLSQARALHRLGVDAFQGYFILKPEARARLQPVSPDWLERDPPAG